MRKCACTCLCDAHGCALFDYGRKQRIRIAWEKRQKKQEELDFLREIDSEIEELDMQESEAYVLEYKRQIMLLKKDGFNHSWDVQGVSLFHEDATRLG